GLALFIFGLIAPVFVPAIAILGLPAKWTATLSGLLMLGVPELLWVAAVVVLGKDGFEAMKSQAFGVIKRHVLPETVSRTRYRIGLVMFLLPVLFGWLAPYAPAEAIPGYEDQRLVFSLIGDGLLLFSLFALGGEFWDKLRALFVFGAKARFPAGIDEVARAKKN
ncbi:MAG: hypothetical protein KJO76_03115, partial [Gammaproteobacteria bacterium]|nr:hypothetical protein [Gammaproteobacteria bacterium]